MQMDFKGSHFAPTQLFGQLLGVNGFTYILLAGIFFFLIMNTWLGPGWLGNIIGIQGTGTFTEVPDSIPDTIDLGNPDYQL